MTKLDYIILAQAINYTIHNTPYMDAKDIKRAMVALIDNLEKPLRKNNPKFNIGLFIKESLVKK